MSRLFALAGLLLGAHAARPCTTQQFQLRILDVRYDGANPADNNDLATIAVGLSTSTTPLYECVAQWPEEWGGFYKASNKPIWAECIYTGANLAPDSAVSFAVDWENRVMYLGHTFECQDQPGEQRLALGALPLDPTCTTSEDNATVCFDRPSTERINTTLTSSPSPSSPECEGTSEAYYSWQLSNWHRQFTLRPGSSGPVENDTGPSFTLRNVATKELNILKIKEGVACDSGEKNAVEGVAFVQAACDKEYNSDVFTCSSTTIWIGTEVV
ncbi:hypothetical protein VTK26DRAFT_2117 [Humicola hyalothermophila]